MLRRIAVRNAEFQKRNQKVPTKQAMTLEELLSFAEIRKLIVEFIIFIRASRFLTNSLISTIDYTTLIEMQNEYYSQLLIMEIIKLPICKTNNCEKYVIEKRIKPLLNDLMLSKHKNDEWALQYIAHFFASHTIYQLPFYYNPLHAIKEKAYEAFIKKNTYKSTEKNISLFSSFQEGLNQHIILIGIAIPEKILFFQNLCQSLFLISSFLIGCIVFFQLVKLLPPMFDEPILTWFNLVVSACISLRINGGFIARMLLSSPYSWDAAGAVIQVGLMDEINNLMSIDNFPNRPKKIFSNSEIYDSAFQKLISITATTLPRIVPSIDDKMPQPDEHKLKEKRKFKSTLPQSLPSLNSFPCVKLTWEDPTIEPLRGIVKNNDIAFMLTPDISRLWSMKRAIHARCRYHFFFQPIHDTSTQHPMAIHFREIISFAHVVPSEAHPGVVELKKDNQDFPGAQYKAKSLSKEAATWRVGLFAFTRSKSIELEGDSKQQLPECLKNKVFYLHKPGPPKQTH